MRGSGWNQGSLNIKEEEGKTKYGGRQLRLDKEDSEAEVNRNSLEGNHKKMRGLREDRHIDN